MDADREDPGRQTFVWVPELEDVQPGGIFWKQHHPASHAHLLTGAGLVLRRVERMLELQASDWFLDHSELTCFLSEALRALAP